MSESIIDLDYDGLLDKSTDPMQHEPDIAAITKLCDLIVDGKIDPEDALQALHGKIVDENPDTVYFALKVLEETFNQCGSLMYKVICTDDYMILLRDIILTTEHKRVSDKILDLLVEWADKFKYFPQYCAPQKILELLKADGYVFPELKSGILENIFELQKFQMENRKAEEPIINNSAHLKRDSFPKYISNNPDKTEDSAKEVKKYFFRRELRAVRDKRKMEYKQYCKSRGIPTTSDEESSCKESSDEEDRITFDEEEDSNTNGWQTKKLESQQSGRKRVLPKELEKLKRQRQQLNADTQQIRVEKHENYMKNCNSNLDLTSCKDKNCDTCKRKSQELENIVIPKRLPYEIRKIKESKEKLKNDFEEYKESQKQAYYNKQTNSRSSIESNFKEKELFKVMEPEDELQQALLLSKLENETQKPCTIRSRLGDMQEERELQEALALSSMRNNENFLISDLEDESEDELQKAINLSFAESEEKNFSPMLKLDDEDLQLKLAKQLSLEEANKIQSDIEISKDVNDWDLCVVCFDTKPLRCFKPCNHKCICESCTKTYYSERCPICREYYIEIL